MNDLAFLFLLVLGFYLLESTAFVRRDELMLTTWLGKAWRTQLAGRFMGNASGGFVLRPLLPPLGEAFVVAAPPVSLSPEGVLGYVGATLHPDGRPPQSGRFYTWEEVLALGVGISGKEVLVGSSVVARATSSRAAEQLGRRLFTLAKETNKKARERVIRGLLMEATDVSSVRQLHAALRRQIRPLRALANAVWVELFVLLPGTWWLFGIGRPLLAVLAGILVSLLSVVLAFFRVHRAVYPGQRGDRWLALVEIALFPPATARAVDGVLRGALDRFLPLTAAAALGASDLEGLARRTLLDAQHPVPSLALEDGSAGQGTERWWRGEQALALGAMLAGVGLDPKALTAAPTRSGLNIAGYCPRCHEQYQAGPSSCEDCGGLTLVPFDLAPVATRTTGS